MAKVIVMYESGRVWSCEVDGVGEGDAGKICASSVSVEVIGGALTVELSVLRWEHGAWSKPTGVVEEWTSVTPGFIDPWGHRHDLKGGAAYSERCTVEKQFKSNRFVLLSAPQLAGAVSVTVEGSLAYASEGGKLVPVVGGDAGNDDGMVAEFATANHPTTHEAFAGFSHASAGTHYEAEV